ncbi:hypothetical protein [Brevibacillus sp. SYSU BS000544]|uniref:hypothetical protein n=1 Tax=Brevibacillus sp. SYSU BS000544 TaxID=3416443 RepID=UPI003CE5439F
MRRILFCVLTVMLLLPSWMAAAAEEAIQSEMYYSIIRPMKGGVEVVNMVSFRNTSKEIYTGSADGKVIKIQLPKGAKDVMMFNEKDTTVKVDKELIYSTQTLSAGQMVDLPYSFKLDGGVSGKIPMTFDYPAGEVHIMIPDGRGDINLENFKADKNSYSFNNQNYTGYTIKGVKAGQELLLSYQAAANTEAAEGGGKIQTPTEQSAWLQFYNQTPLRTIEPRIFIAIVAALLVIGLLYGFSRWQKKRMGAARENETIETVEQLLAKQTVLMDKLVELEQSHKEQKISDEEFAKKQGAYKDLLVQVKLRLKEQSNTQ